MRGLIEYFGSIKLDKAILWCYLIWYAVVIYFHFDPSPKVWINSIGISAVIGTGLVLSVAANPDGERDHWQTFRLYLMPFCVSSFSALIKEQGFMVILSPQIRENLIAIFCCVLFLAIVYGVKRVYKLGV